MKKLLTGILVGSLLTVMSMTESLAQFSAGIRLGFNASKYTGSSNKLTPGFHIGPYFRVGFKDKYRVQLELLASTKGAVVTVGTEKFHNIPLYLDIPVMFNYKPVAGLYIEAGVQPSIILTAASLNANTETKFSTTGYKTVDFAPVAGLGYEFKKASLGIRGTLGVTNINSLSTSVLDQKTVSLMATFAFKF